MNPRFQPLFAPFQFANGVSLKNRVVMAPMTNYSSNSDGTVSNDEVDYYIRRAGGVGMVITACTYVCPNGQGFPGEFAGHCDEMIPSLRRLAQAIQAQGAKGILQIFHGGRLCPAELVPNGDVVSASAVPAERQGVAIPRALTDTEISDIIHAFGETTRRAIEAGYDGVELHGAKGYIRHQFFSPHSNRREDRWGGSLEKRLSFPLAVVDEVTRVVERHATRPFIVGYRFSPEEPETPGITMDDTLQLVDALAKKKLDYLHVSLMEFWSKPKRSSDTSKSRIQLIQERVGQQVPVIGVGSLHTAEDAIQALTGSGVPLIALGRELILEPDWVQKIQGGREQEIQVTLTERDREKLVVPEPLWRAIIGRPGWFPVVETTK